MKDNIDVAGLPTTAGCSGFCYVPDHSAPAVAHLLEAGAICIGKTNLDQFATGLCGMGSPYGICAAVSDGWNRIRLARDTGADRYRAWGWRGGHARPQGYASQGDRLGTPLAL